MENNNKQVANTLKTYIKIFVLYQNLKQKMSKIKDFLQQTINNVKCNQWMIKQCNITYKTLLQGQGVWHAKEEPIEIASQQFEFPQQ